jgi:hypothetical protein
MRILNWSKFELLSSPWRNKKIASLSLEISLINASVVQATKLQFLGRGSLWYSDMHRKYMCTHNLSTEMDKPEQIHPIYYLTFFSKFKLFSYSSMNCISLAFPLVIHSSDEKDFFLCAKIWRTNLEHCLQCFSKFYMQFTVLGTCILYLKSVFLDVNSN